MWKPTMSLKTKVVFVVVISIMAVLALGSAVLNQAASVLASAVWGS
jgi:hypothetical protein